MPAHHSWASIPVALGGVADHEGEAPEGTFSLEDNLYQGQSPALGVRIAVAEREDQGR